MSGADRALRWDACLNVRDLGGLSAAAGRVRRGALVRADALYRLNAVGREAMAAHGVRTVIDIRYPRESAAYPDPFEDGGDRIAYLNLPLETDAASKVASASSSRVEFSAVILELCRANFGAIAAAIADAGPGGIVIHCTAGKDRTGLMTVLLLDLLGTPAEEIGADYALTEAALAPLFDELIAQAETAERRAEALLALGNPEGLRQIADQNDRVAHASISRARTRSRDIAVRPQPRR